MRCYNVCKLRAHRDRADPSRGGGALFCFATESLDSVAMWRGDPTQR